MTTHAFTQEAFAALGAPSLVYVRPVRAEEALGDAAPQALAQLDLPPDQVLYALHGADGVQLALLADRDSAYAAARAHELAPVAVH